MLKNITVIALFCFIVFINPVFTIMALNSLFNIGIPLTLGTWVAMFWLNLVTFGGVTASVSSLRK